MEIECTDLNTFDYSVTLPFSATSPSFPETFFKIVFNCNGVTYTSPDFSDGETALSWVQNNLGDFGTWTLDGDVLEVTGTLCGTASLVYLAGEAIIRGCTDDITPALNFDSDANVDDGSCVYNSAPPTPNYIDIICANTPLTQTIEYTPGLFFDTYKETCNTNIHRPMFIGLHPGGDARGNYKAYPKDFAQRGYLGASADYGETTPYTNARQIEAVINMILLVIYCKTNAVALGINQSNIFVGGTSAGAVTTYQFMLIATALNSGNAATVAAAQALLATASNYSLLSGKDLTKCVPSGTFTQAGAASPTFTPFIGTWNKRNKFYNGTLDCTVYYSKAQCGTKGALENYNSMQALGNLSTFSPWLNDSHSIDSHHDAMLLGGTLNQVVGVADSTYGSNTFTTDIGIVQAFKNLIVP